MSHPYDTESASSPQLPTDPSLQLPSARGLQRQTARHRILVVEDEPSIRTLLRLHLSLANFDVEESDDGADALDLARSDKFALVLLDVMLPGLDGLTLCRAIRTLGANVATPILMLSARGTEADKVLGLESGADDYLTKPFGIREMLARVAALLRRSDRLDAAAPAAARRVQARDLTLDAERRDAIVRGRNVDLTKQEFDLLYLLAARPGIVFSRATLLSKVWSDDVFVTERTVDTVVSRLRKKIEREAQDPELILTAWGVGYKFADVE
jgi:two-component system, OmpR family, alkaline phosphatase synthesis response regulator PhoP